MTGTHQPIRVERLIANRLDTVDVDDIKAGDVVDVPVWMDLWYGPSDMRLQPWTFLSFDRLVILEGARKEGVTVVE